MLVNEIEQATRRRLSLMHDIGHVDVGGHVCPRFRQCRFGFGSQLLVVFGVDTRHPGRWRRGNHRADHQRFTGRARQQRCQMDGSGTVTVGCVSREQRHESDSDPNSARFFAPSRECFIP